MITIVDADRDPAGQDFAFAADTWLRSYRQAANGGASKAPPHDLAQLFARNMDQYTYYLAMRPLVTAQLRSPANQFRLAHVEGERDIYAGWACIGPDALHYVYVKKAFRRQGVMTELVMGATGYSMITWPWLPDALDALGSGQYLPADLFKEPST